MAKKKKNDSVHKADAKTKAAPQDQPVMSPAHTAENPIQPDEEILRSGTGQAAGGTG